MLICNFKIVFISSLAYWNILDLTDDNPEPRALFSVEDWNDIVRDFQRDIRLVQSDIPDVVIQFFDEIEKVRKIVMFFLSLL
jgi:hypothetical protein